MYFLYGVCFIQGKQSAGIGSIYPSGFWPPYAYIYWPFGFRLNCYDLTKDFVEECLPASKTAAAKVAVN